MYVSLIIKLQLQVQIILLNFGGPNDSSCTADYKQVVSPRVHFFDQTLKKWGKNTNSKKTKAYSAEVDATLCL